jgi:RNA polymerase sigma factor (sigma-70 family)
MKSYSATDTALPGVSSSAVLQRAELERTFDRLFADNGPALSRLAGSYTNTAGDRDDLLQDIAMAVWKALPRFRGECSERTFLFRIAHNRGATWLARNLPRRTVENQAVDTLTVEPRGPAVNAEMDLDREQRSERLRRAIRLLPMNYRQVILLALEEMDYPEIAAVLGISESNVGARLTRARQMLREKLERSL